MKNPNTLRVNNRLKTFKKTVNKVKMFGNFLKKTNKTMTEKARRLVQFNNICNVLQIDPKEEDKKIIEMVNRVTLLLKSF